MASDPTSGVTPCPKCGIEAPGAPECRRCGVLVDHYRGPALGAAALRPPASAPPTAASAAPRPEPGPPAPAPSVAAGPPGLPPPDRYQGTFEIGDLLRQTFAVFFKNLVPLCLLTALALLPLFLFKGYELLVGPASLVAGRWIRIGLASICANLATAAVTYGVLQQLRGASTTVADCLRRGAVALFTVLGLVLVQSVAVWGGFLLCFIPGVVLLLQWAVAVPVAVTEGAGIGLALSRSTFLTDGLRWEIFGTGVVLFVVRLGVVLVVNLAAPGHPAAAMLLLDASEILGTGLSATSAAVIYYRLRSLKEGLDSDGIAAVFA